MSNSRTSKKKSQKGISNSQAKASKDGDKGEGDVLLNLPAGFKYRLPGKKQRIIMGSLVLGLNVLLVLAVGLYFYSPSFQEFIYNYGR